MRSQIVEAIRLMKKIVLNYKGEGIRLVCPHALYVSSTGKILCDSYQLSGYSNHSENVHGWRPFDVSKVTNLKILDETFNIAPGYNPYSDKYFNSIAKL